MSSVSVDGLVLADFLRSSRTVSNRIAFVVTGGGGSGKSAALRSFLSGCEGHGYHPRKITLSSSTAPASIFYGDYSTSTSLLLAQPRVTLPSVLCLVFDDVHIWAQMRLVCAENVNTLADWPGHLVLSAPSLDCVPPSVSSAFILVEYPIVLSHQYAFRRIREAHPKMSRASAQRLVGLLPRGISTADLMAIIQSATASSQVSSGDSSCDFENSFVKSIPTAKASLKDRQLPRLPPCLVAISDRMCLLLNQHLARFNDGDEGCAGAVSRHSSSTTGILLSGVTGCGKSLITYVLEEAFPTVPFLRVCSFEFFAKYLGESEEKLREFFRYARRHSPCVVIMEDIDVLAQSRTESTEGSSVGKRILTALLCELDGVEDTSGVLVIGTTSASKTIDAALLRQGRLETVIEIPCLSRSDVDELLLSKQSLLTAAGVSPDDIAPKLTGKTLSNFASQMRLLLESTLTE